VSYFAPYIDSSGIHMPTYEDRLSDLCAAYRNIFGQEAELSASVPDYQLLSVLARALDDTSALVVQDFNSRNPLYASGAALDLLLPQYGLVRQAGESDGAARARIANSLAGAGAGSYDALRAAILNARSVSDVRLYVNETDSTDSIGIPAHSIAAVTRAGNAQAIAQAIFDKKPPGIGTYGITSATALDAEGNPHTVYFTRFAYKPVYTYVFIRILEGGEETAVREAVTSGIYAFVGTTGIRGTMKIGEPLNIPQLYGVAYAANPAVANTFVITDIQVSIPGETGVRRDIVPVAWNEVAALPPEAGVDIRVVE